MKVRILIASAILGLSMTAVAMAASITPPDKCRLYARDLSEYISLIKLSGDVEAAKQALEQGKDQCAHGKYDEGIATLMNGIKALNLPPNQY
jgi:predicted outer membrane protein